MECVSTSTSTSHTHTHTHTHIHTHIHITHIHITHKRVPGWKRPPPACGPGPRPPPRRHDTAPRRQRAPAARCPPHQAARDAGTARPMSLPKEGTKEEKRGKGGRRYCMSVCVSVGKKGQGKQKATQPNLVKAKASLHNSTNPRESPAQTLSPRKSEREDIESRM